MKRLKKWPVTAWLCCGLSCFTSFPLLAKTPAADYQWQSAPSEQMEAELSIKEAILRAFGRHPQIAQASAQIHVGAANLTVAKSAWFPQISLQSAAGRSHQTTLPVR